jgi:RNA recognition motif-containing protein
VPDGSIVAFVPRGQEAKLAGKVKSQYVSTLDNNLYLRIKAEDGRTYTKQLKNVELLNEKVLPKEKKTEVPQSLYNELKQFSKTLQTNVNESEIAALVKKYFKQELMGMAKTL